MLPKSHRSIRVWLLSLSVGWLSGCFETPIENPAAPIVYGDSIPVLQENQDTSITLDKDTVRVFQIKPQDSTRYTIQVTGIDPDSLILMDSLGNDLIKSSYYSMTWKTNSKMSLFVKIKSLKKDSSKVAKISLAAKQDRDAYENDNTWEKAGLLIAGSPEQYHTMTPYTMNDYNYDVDWYKIPVDSGKNYWLTIKTIDYPSSYENSQSLVYSKDKKVFGYLANGRLIWKSKVTDTLRLVYSIGSNGDRYSIKLVSDSVNVDEYEVDNDRTSATELKIDSAYQNHNIDTLDMDWYKISSSEPKTVALLIQSDEQLFVTHFKNDQFVRNQNTNTGIDVEKIILPKDSVYFVRVNGFTATKRYTPYRIRLVSESAVRQNYEPNDSANQATLLKLGDTTQFHYLSLRESDYFRFSVDSGVRYALERIGSTQTGVYLYQDSLRKDSIYSSQSTSSWVSKYTGTGYARIVGVYPSSSEGFYQIRLVLDSTGFDLYEPDDRKENARNILPDSTGQKRYMRMNDTDWVRLSVEKGKRYEVARTGNIYTNLKIYTDSLETDSISYGYGSASFTSMNNGTYWIKIMGSSLSDTGAYTLEVKNDTSEADLYEFDDNRNHVNVLVVDGELQYHTITKGDIDFYAFDIPNDYKYKYEIQVTPESFIDWGNIFIGPITGYSTYVTSFPATYIPGSLVSGRIYFKLYSADLEKSVPYTVRVVKKLY